MIAQKYDGVHFQVVTMNMWDGSVQGHAAGCADLKRGKAKFAEPSQANDVMDVLCKHDAWLDYNADFIDEGSTYDIDWAPCADAIPETTVVSHEPVLGVKRGPKWTYIFVDDVQVMEVRSDLADTVLASVKFF